MPRKSTKNKDSISAAQRRRSGRVAPLPPVPSISTETSSPSPSLTSPSVPVANPKNIDDINWRHPAELAQIFPEKNAQADIIPILQSQAYSVPGQPADPKDPFCEITLAIDNSKIIVPVGYRIPLMFCAKYLWESVRLVLTSDDPSPEEEWQNYKFDLVNLSKLCFMFLQSARTGMIKKRKGGLNVRWRNAMFDRVLTRYWWGWMVNREEFIRAFWMEFKEEEYERDACRRDWKTMTLKGHNGFYLTPSEQQNGITAEQFTAGLTPIYSSPTPSPSPTTPSRSLPSPQPQAQPHASTITSYTWDNTAYALANELVVTGTHISSDPVHIALRREEKEWEEEGWEGEEGRKRKRKRMKVMVKSEPGEEEEMGVVMRELGLGGEVDNAIVGEVGGDMDSVVVGDVQVPQTPVPLRGLPTPPPTGPQRSPLSASVLTPESSFIISPLSPSPPPSPIAAVNTQKKTAHSSNAKESTSGGSVHGDEERDVQMLEKVVGVTPAPSFIQNSEVPGSSPMDTTVVEKESGMAAAQCSNAVQLDELHRPTPVGTMLPLTPASSIHISEDPGSATIDTTVVPKAITGGRSPAIVQLEPNRASSIGSSADAEPRTASIVESRPSSAQDGLESGTDKDPIPIASSSPPSQVEQSPDQSMDIDATPVHHAPPPPPFVTWPVAVEDVSKNTVRTEARASLPVALNIPDETSASTELAGTRKVTQLNGSVREDVSGTTDPTPPSFITSTSKYASSPNPEVITQVLNVVPSMLSQLHSLLDVASSENALLSSSNDNESAIEKIRLTTTSLFATQSTSSDTLVSTLIERMNALESEVKSNQEELKRSQEENERTTLRVVELEARLKACESHSSEHVIAPNHVDNGISSMGYSTPLSRTNSIDESIPLPIKSQRKQMNLIAISPSKPPSTDGDGLV